MLKACQSSLPVYNWILFPRIAHSSGGITGHFSLFNIAHKAAVNMGHTIHSFPKTLLGHVIINYTLGSVGH